MRISSSEPWAFEKPWMLRARDPVVPTREGYPLLPTPGGCSQPHSSKQYPDVSSRDHKRLTSHVSRSAICRSESGDSRTRGEIREARQHVTTTLPGKEVHGGAVVPVLVPQLPYDQLRRRAGRQRQHRPHQPGELAGGAKGVGSSFG